MPKKLIVDVFQGDSELEKIGNALDQAEEEMQPNAPAPAAVPAAPAGEVTAPEGAI